MILVIIIIICVWLMGQFMSAVAGAIALGIIGLYLVIALLSKIANSKKASNVSSKVFGWINKRPANAYIAIFLLFACAGLIGVLIGASQLNDSDISWQSVSYETNDSFIGIEYSEMNYGVLVTNNSDEVVTVNMKAEYYNEDKNLIRTTGDHWTGAMAPGQSKFVEFDGDEDAKYVKYFMEEQKRADYIPLNVGFDDGCEVVFSINEAEEKFTIDNNTVYDIFAGCQFIYYNEDGEVVYVNRFGSYEISANKAITEWFEMTEPTIEYETCETICYAFKEK